MAEDAACARESERTRGAWLDMAHGAKQRADNEACVGPAIDLHFEHAFGHAVAIGKADLTFGPLRHGVQEVIRGRCTRPNAFGRVRVYLAAADSQSILAIEDGSCRPRYTDQRTRDRDAGAAHFRLDLRAHLRARLLKLGQAC